MASAKLYACSGLLFEWKWKGFFGNIFNNIHYLIEPLPAGFIIVTFFVYYNSTLQAPSELYACSGLFFDLCVRDFCCYSFWLTVTLINDVTRCPLFPKLKGFLVRDPEVVLITPNKYAAPILLGLRDSCVRVVWLACWIPLLVILCNRV